MEDNKKRIIIKTLNKINKNAVKAEHDVKDDKSNYNNTQKEENWKDKEYNSDENNEDYYDKENDEEKESDKDEEESEELKNDEEEESDKDEDSDEDLIDEESENNLEKKDLNDINPADRKNLHPPRNVNNQSDNEQDNKDDEEYEDIDDDEDESFAHKVENIEESIKKINNAVNKGVKIVSNILTLFINPIFWIIIAIGIVIIYTSSLISIIGQNDYNMLCDDLGIGSIMLDANADDFTRQSAIVAWLTSTPFELTGGQPFSREQAIAIMGNLMQESYGANPKTIQGDHSITDWETCDNNCVLDWGNIGGKAIGIIQWDTGRRIGLVNFAISEGTQWHDLNTQLKFLKKEIDSGYNSDQLVQGGFADPSKSLAEYVSIWNIYFERSAAAGTPGGDNPRIAYAEEFAQRYTGSHGGSVGGGLATNCISGGMMGGIDTSNLVQLAIASAWPFSQRSNANGSCAGGLVNCGQDFAMEAYRQAKLVAEAATGKDPISGLLASCDRYVATMFRATGKDPSFPWGNTGTQGAYMRSNPDWVQVSCQDRQPGDVVWRNGHIMLYLGTVDGKDSIGSASLGERTGSIGGLSCQGPSFIADGDAAIGFRKVR